MTNVLGLDLSKVGLCQALEAMAEAWLDAQGVEEIEGRPQSREPSTDSLSDRDKELWRSIESMCGEQGHALPRADFGGQLSMEGLAAACERLRSRGLIWMRKESYQSEDGHGGGSRWMVCPYWMAPF